LRAKGFPRGWGGGLKIHQFIFETRQKSAGWDGACLDNPTCNGKPHHDEKERKTKHTKNEGEIYKPRIAMYEFEVSLGNDPPSHDLHGGIGGCSRHSVLLAEAGRNKERSPFPSAHPTAARREKQPLRHRLSPGPKKLAFFAQPRDNDEGGAGRGRKLSGSVRWCQNNGNRSNQKSKFDFVATHQIKWPQNQILIL